MGKAWISLIVRCCFVVVIIAMMAVVEPNANFVQEVSAVTVDTQHTSVLADSCVGQDDSVTGLGCKRGKVSARTAIWLFLVVLAAFVGLSSKRRL